MAKNTSVEGQRVVFVSWAPYCSRSDSIAERLGGTSYMVYSGVWGSRYATILFKYSWQLIRTLWILIRVRPQAVLVMAPPVIACIPVWLYTKLTGGSYVIDAHTATFVNSPWKSLLFLQRFFSRHAAATFVTNDHFGAILRAWNCRVQIVEDVPVCFAKPEEVVLTGCNITLVNSFTEDEPLEVFLEAARTVPEIQFHVTGDVKDADPRIFRIKPDNVRFTGYLPNGVYAGLLLASDAVMSLTKVDHTMQRGAYEAVYLGKPVITSNFGILRRAFYKGAVHVDSTVEDIVNGVREMKTNLMRYGKEVQELRAEKLARWQIVESHLRQLFPRV